MATIEDYRKQRILAEQLRKREAALGAAIQSGDPTLVTRGSRGATYDMPDIYQANVAGALAKAGGGFLAGRAGRQATDAETSAEEKRQAALEQVMGAAGVAGGTMTPQQAIQLQELGVEVDVGDFLPKPKTPPAPGAILQAIQSGLPPAIAQKVARGEDLTPDEIMTVQKAQQAKADQEFARKKELKGIGASSAGASPKPPTMKQLEAAALTKVLAAKTPEERQAAQVELDTIRGQGDMDYFANMTAGEKKEYDKVIERLGASESAVGQMAELQRIIRGNPTPVMDPATGQPKLDKSGNPVMEYPAEANPGDPFSGQQRGAAALMEYGRTEDSGVIGALANIAGRAMASGDTLKMGALTRDSVLKDMQKLGGNDSNQELSTILNKYPSNISSREDAMALAQELMRWQQIAVRANQLEADSRRTGQYLKRGNVNFHKLATEQLMAEGGLQGPVVTSAQVEQKAREQNADAPVPGYEDLWADMTPEEKAEARK